MDGNWERWRLCLICFRMSSGVMYLCMGHKTTYCTTTTTTTGKVHKLVNMQFCGLCKLEGVTCVCKLFFILIIPHLPFPHQQRRPSQQMVDLALSAEVAQQQRPQDIKVLSNLWGERKFDAQIFWHETTDCLVNSPPTSQD